MQIFFSETVSKIADKVFKFLMKGMEGDADINHDNQITVENYIVM